MPDLDSPASYAAHDPRGMLAHITGLPEQCERAWLESAGISFPEAFRKVTGVLILGLGGSAIGGDLLRCLIADECPVPVVLHRDYGLPGWVSERTLVLACSYSGNTEETLSAFGAAANAGARLFAMTTGGRLLQRARELGAVCYCYHYEAQPRAALGYSLMTLLRVMDRLGLVRDKSGEVAEAVTVMRSWLTEIGPEVAVTNNAAKALATRLYRRLPVIYGAEHLAEVARRWKGQFNENSKSWAVFDVAPELAHNTIAGYQSPARLAPLAHTVVLTAPSLHPRVQARLQFARELLSSRGFASEAVEGRGQSRLAQALSLVLFGDLVSYYLSLLYGVDPWEIANIDAMKRRMGAA
ncbi:MAG TPA: bifunctional phosphoglucose/phosphomannose isomerase [Anaerolineae bacterium]|nr:bifunctional phosphoglucose/phosphomannose isomerase [Anaerolineae bacterium]HQJ51087.1 bifunctional phosphoglucose/phosphomannose isomerase [Anaerolineae bacterium]